MGRNNNSLLLRLGIYKRNYCKQTIKIASTTSQPQYNIPQHQAKQQQPSLVVVVLSLSLRNSRVTTQKQRRSFFAFAPSSFYLYCTLVTDWRWTTGPVGCCLVAHSLYSMLRVKVSKQAGRPCNARQASMWRRRLSSSSFSIQSIPKQKHFYMFLNVSIVPLFNMPFSWFCFIVLHITYPSLYSAFPFFMRSWLVGWLTVVQFNRVTVDGIHEERG